MKSFINKYTLLGLFATILLASCHNLIEGNGNITASTINYPISYNEIELTSNFTVYLNQDTGCAVTVQGYENLTPYVTVTGDANKLTIGTKQDYILENNNVVVYITMPLYTSVKLSSGGSIVASDSIISNTIEITNNGSGTISLFGDANVINAYSAGSGITRLCSFQADTVSAFMLGSGVLSTKPLNKLNAQVQGSGQIQYLGTPTLNFSITGTGSLLQALGCY